MRIMKERRHKINNEEIGINADPVTVGELTEEITSTWRVGEHQPKKPVLLFLSGFQGSGKTTALEILRKETDLIIVSPDEIRQKLFERNWEVSEKFIHTVNATKNNLLKRALLSGSHIAIDEFATETRINLASKIIKEADRKYKTLTVYLDTPENILEQRVKERKGFVGKYKGTVAELRDSIRKHGHPKFGLFDRVLDSSKMSAGEIAAEIKRMIG